MSVQLKKVLSNIAADKEKVKLLFADFDYLKRLSASRPALRPAAEVAPQTVVSGDIDNDD